MKGCLSFEDNLIILHILKFVNIHFMQFAHKNMVAICYACSNMHKNRYSVKGM